MCTALYSQQKEYIFISVTYNFRVAFTLAQQLSLLKHYLELSLLTGRFMEDLNKSVSEAAPFFWKLMYVQWQ